MLAVVTDAQTGVHISHLLGAFSRWRDFCFAFRICSCTCLGGGWTQVGGLQTTHAATQILHRISLVGGYWVSIGWFVGGKVTFGVCRLFTLRCYVRDIIVLASNSRIGAGAFMFRDDQSWSHGHYSLFSRSSYLFIYCRLRSRTGMQHAKWRTMHRA